MVQAENLRLDLTRCDGRCTDRNSTALQLGVCLGDDKKQAVRLHQGETLSPQLCRKKAQGLRGCGGYGSHQRHAALDTRVYHDIATADNGHGSGDSFNLGVDEVKCDRRPRTRRNRGRRRKCLAILRT